MQSIAFNIRPNRMSGIFDNSFRIDLKIIIFYDKYKVHLIIDDLLTQFKVGEVINGIQTEREVLVSVPITSTTPTGDVLAFCTNLMRRYIT
jgi:hypothetical protein